MNFDFTDDQQSIKQTAKQLLTARFKADHLRELAEGAAYDDAVWKELCGLGWPGIFLPEEQGGQGLGTVELVILMEELGYALAPLPFLSTISAALVIQHAGSDEQRERWLAPLASGEARGAFGYVRNGVAQLVPDAVGADVVVLVENGKATLHESPTVEPIEAIDMVRRFGSIAAGGGDPMPGDPGPALDRIVIALSAETVGVAQRTMEMAVDYARERKQFNTPIGAYQGVSHRCAQMLLETEGARSLTYYAGWTADSEPESLSIAASMAKSFSSDAGWRVTASALQVHGGIGFTWEHDLHFYLKRARTNAHLFGSAREHRERVAALRPIGA